MPKRLAGPPEEFAMMRAVEPAAAAIHSSSALLRIEMAQRSTKSGKPGAATWSGRLPAEGERLRFVVYSAGSDWDAELASPNGLRSKAAGVREQTSLGLGDAQLPVQRFDVAAAAAGEWSLSLRGSAAKAGGAQRGFVLLEGDATTELASYRTGGSQLLGERIGFTAMLTATADDDILLGTDAGRIARATLEVTAPDGSLRRFRMLDDGLHGDGHAGDGVYGASFQPAAAGSHIAQVVVRGQHADGRTLLRTAEHIVPVVEPSLQLAAIAATGAAKADGRIVIDLPVALAKSAGAPSHYRGYAEVWGHDAQGAAVPVAWIGGMVSPRGASLPLELDQRWIDRSGAQAPFELRNLRLEHPDAFVTVAAAERLSLQLPRNTRKAAAADIAIDRDMLMGPAPAQLAQAKATGARLLLVHGYCSGGVWPATQFSNDATFLDTNQNRSHDDFARRIQAFGNNWNSFGIVAHSQGGAAALHLYTYYWSGLDRAGSGRLIQSVGTPYQGTNLAGILAAVGSWFGVGCGTNNDLSYSGSSAWLAGIPSWARAKVNYYTTSFRTTNWWTNDYCNFASDLVLGDPEDGTTEKAYGQLPYGINRGHTSGQCHTTGMRDPAQYRDSNRNAVMNANAAR